MRPGPCTFCSTASTEADHCKGMSQQCFCKCTRPVLTIAVIIVSNSDLSNDQSLSLVLIREETVQFTLSEELQQCVYCYTAPTENHHCCGMSQQCFCSCLLPLVKVQVFMARRQH